MAIKRLMEWEKDLLPLSLITPKKMARQILKRNKPMLKAWEGGEDEMDYFRGDVGCPHCIESRELTSSAVCYACRWAVLADSFHGTREICLATDFGDFNTEESGIHYQPYSEDFLCHVPSEYEATGVVLKGHIRWANRILDGTYKEYAKKHGIKKPRRVGKMWEK